MSEANYEVRADVAKNRFYVTMRGYLSDAEVAGVADQTIEAMGKLKAGFACISDISTFKPTSPTGAEELKRAQAALVEHGVKRIVRISQSMLSKLQLERTGKAAGYEDGITETVASLEEAEARLEELGL